MTDNKGTQGSTPVPDPTLLTTEALKRDNAALKELFGQQLRALQDLAFERISKNRAICDTRFQAIDHELSIGEDKRIEQKKDTKDAVDAALRAADARTNKSEISTNEAIKQLGVKFDIAIEAQRREINDLKDRINRTAGNKEGGELQMGKIYAAIGAVGAVLAIIVLLANGVIR
jgi:hypothetical protein